MKYKHLSQAERYQIYALMIAGHDRTQIAKLLDRLKNTISRELIRNTGSHGCRDLNKPVIPRQSVRKTVAMPQPLSRGYGKKLALFCACNGGGRSKLPISHETLYQHVYADKAQGGVLRKNLRRQKQKRTRYAGGRDRRAQILDRRSLSERPLHIEARKQIGHWECDTVIRAKHKGAVVTIVERKSGYAVIAKVPNKTSGLVSSAIVSNLKPLAIRVKTLTYDDGKEFAAHGLIDQQLSSTAYFARPLASYLVLPLNE